MPKTHNSIACPATTLVLYVEDDHVNQQVLQHCLASEPGFRIITAFGSDDTLEALESEQYLPDIVLMDNQLMGTTGSQVIALIRAAYGDTMPFVICTALDISSTTALMLTTRSKGFLNKPYTRHQLLAVIKEHAVSSSRPYMCGSAAPSPQYHTHSVSSQSATMPSTRAMGAQYRTSQELIPSHASDSWCDGVQVRAQPPPSGIAPAGRDAPLDGAAVSAPSTFALPPAQPPSSPRGPPALQSLSAMSQHIPVTLLSGAVPQPASTLRTRARLSAMPAPSASQAPSSASRGNALSFTPLPPGTATNPGVWSALPAHRTQHLDQHLAHHTSPPHSSGGTLSSDHALPSGIRVPQQTALAPLAPQRHRERSAAALRREERHTSPAYCCEPSATERYHYYPVDDALEGENASAGATSHSQQQQPKRSKRSGPYTSSGMWLPKGDSLMSINALTLLRDGTLRSRGTGTSSQPWSWPNTALESTALNSVLMAPGSSRSSRGGTNDSWDADVPGAAREGGAHTGSGSVEEDGFVGAHWRSSGTPAGEVAPVEMLRDDSAFGRSMRCPGYLFGRAPIPAHAAGWSDYAMPDERGEPFPEHHAKSVSTASHARASSGKVSGDPDQGVEELSVKSVMRILMRPAVGPCSMTSSLTSTELCDILELPGVGETLEARGIGLQQLSAMPAWELMENGVVVLQQLSKLMDGLASLRA